jgi:hypothetical protein
VSLAHLPIAYDALGEVLRAVELTHKERRREGTLRDETPPKPRRLEQVLLFTLAAEEPGR